MSTVTSIGIGNMGAAIATALLKSSVKLTLWNRTASRPQVQAVMAAGATFESSLSAAIAASEVVLLCVLDYPVLSAIFSQLDPATRPLQGKTVLNLTNGTPKQARDMEAYMKTTLGAAAYLDGGIMVTPQLVGTPASFLVLSGESEAVYRARLADTALLEPVGKLLYISPDAGAASLVDCAALAAMYGMFVGAFTGIGLLKRQKGLGDQDGKKKGLAVKPLVDGVMVSLLKELVPYVSLLADQIDREDWMDDLGNPLAMQAVGVRNIMQSCEEEGVDGSGLAFLSGLMDKAVQDGFGTGGVAVVAKYLMNSSDRPPYAILSHTWGPEEVTFQDITSPERAQKKGFAKIEGCCRRARADGLHWVWVDTCCIDKTSSAELSEAINSMYAWYRDSAVCYVYLKDVVKGDGFPLEDFLSARWFTRGWCLQELIAPRAVEFYATDWSEIGTKFSRCEDIERRTSIPRSVLLRQDLDQCSIAQKTSWASERQTTRIEDEAYCLLGLFGVHMPLL
ncbi:heterokaryon incompatibility protein-domain-containing protein [Chaetomium strumarium]|uniref:Heterokaryon incompatibility protein-domain-containing protein n=1 Tax=Chaetomium strumarium TaxID=1170767 RepID=A0AAJ0H0B1_9PEZI|nr:heterokaryon incompatibility protein-domain-containing protein [Chaetomium strumarium]